MPIAPIRALPSAVRGPVEVPHGNEHAQSTFGKLDRHPFAALTSLIPALSCRSCRPHAPFAELVRLADKSVADDLHEKHTRQVLGE